MKKVVYISTAKLASNQLRTNQQLATSLIMRELVQQIIRP